VLTGCAVWCNSIDKTGARDIFGVRVDYKVVKAKSYSRWTITRWVPTRRPAE
jgi:hypothetical protein